ncbi:photosystem II cytochrome PsbV2 [Leptodesmis sp.]|uniref:photosystem II cytochrome PsbV2 n=1 Tax=Leptodesmis sp. TaxID=3100501 RepID=UPI0040535553
MLHQKFWLPLLAWIAAIFLPMVLVSLPAQAVVDPYVTRYLKVTEPIPLVVDEQGSTRLFSAAEISSGKSLFEKNCLNCHVGGNTLPDPTVPLSLTALAGATPRRDTIQGLVAYLRHPMTYDGSEESFWCRKVPESWLATPDVEAIAAFILRAAEKAPGWGTETFEGG